MLQRGCFLWPPYLQYGGGRRPPLQRKSKQSNEAITLLSDPRTDGTPVHAIAPAVIHWKWLRGIDL
jgi:hypothetical protein